MQRDRSVEVVGLEEEVAGQRLLDRDERAVGGQRPAVLDADGRRDLRLVELQARADAGGLVDRLVVAEHGVLLVVR